MSWEAALLRWLRDLWQLDGNLLNQSWVLMRGQTMSVIPYLVLMVVLGSRKLLRRLIGGGAGLAAIGLWQVLTPLVLYGLAQLSSSERVFFVGIFPLFMLSYSLPFVLWLVFSRDRLHDLFSKTTMDRKERSTP